jgi:hypothetical protein
VQAGPNPCVSNFPHQRVQVMECPLGLKHLGLGHARLAYATACLIISGPRVSGKAHVPRRRHRFVRLTGAAITGLLRICGPRICRF